MAQTNPVQDQPSMDDILASIRRIIDDGSAKKSGVPTSEEVANDDAAVGNSAAPTVEEVEVSTPPIQQQSSVPSPSLEQKPSTAIQESPVTQEVGVPELDSFLETLDAKHAQTDQPNDKAELGEAGETKPSDTAGESSGSDLAAIVRKYEQRFSERDRTAFTEVGNVLAATAQRTNSLSSDGEHLVSADVRQAIGSSFENLNEVLHREVIHELPQVTEKMLKPMLSDWLDNNLPSMVERLVRSEIERIARGE